MLFFLSTFKHWALFFHWFADSTEIKYTWVCNNKRKACQLCEILGHSEAENWTTWGQPVLCCGWHFSSWMLLSSMSNDALTVWGKQNPSLPIDSGRLTYASSCDTHFCTHGYTNDALLLPWVRMFSAAFQWRAQWENRTRFHTFCRDIWERGALCCYLSLCLLLSALYPPGAAT